MVKNAIKVYARLKPEKFRKKVTEHEVYHRPKEHADEDFLVLTAPPRICNEYIDNRPESWNFSFFKIFKETVEQETIFDEVAKPVIHSVLDGYNGTIFAYGQTGSGKTYTITGEQEDFDLQGILPRTLKYLFDTVKEQPENLYSIEVSYLEIYNENGYDLLNRKQNWGVVTKLDDLPRVTIQEDETGTLHLKNLSFWSVSNEKDALDLLFIGNTNRSERVYKCAITGTILTEAKHINLSLHYLEQVIVCLGQQNANHIPYRNSLLTAILRDSLGGNCLTTMLATLSLSVKNLEETISTCRFSQRVALVRNDLNLVVQHDVHSENALLKMENERLKQQIDEFKNQFFNQSPRELNEDEKTVLDTSVNRFLEFDQNFTCDNDPRKLKYCLDSLKKKLKLKKPGKESKTLNSESLEYYKNLILQRDKEISLLIDMLKKERKRIAKQKIAKDVSHEKKNEDLKENGTEILSSVSTKEPINIKEPSKEYHKKNLVPELSQLKSVTDQNQTVKNEKVTSENDTVLLTPQDILKLKNLISMCNEHILNQNQLLIEEKYITNKQEVASSEKLNVDKPESEFISKNQKSPLEKEVNKSHSEKLVNPNFLVREPIISLANSTKSKVVSVPESDNRGSNYSVKHGVFKESHYPEVATLNLFEIVKDEFQDKTILNCENFRKHKSEHKSKSSSNLNKQTSKSSSKCNLFTESASNELTSKNCSEQVEKCTELHEKSLQNTISDIRKIEEIQNFSCKFPIVSNNENKVEHQNNNENRIQCETIMSHRTIDFTRLENEESLVRKQPVKDLGSVNLESSRSMSSVKSETSGNITNLPELSRNSICINNDANKSISNSNAEFLNSSSRERNESQTAELMHRFQANIIDSRMTWKSSDSPKQKSPSSISNSIEIIVEKSAKELEKRLLSNNEDNLEEELIRMTEYLPSSTRSSFRTQRSKRKEEDLNFDKSLPLTGDPDIDEEIIAFYKAKRAGGIY